ncbi:MAG TPA: hypothetical protein DCY20_11330 [Firmicutes bacterium]|nr:hypothetical protein [Bacillota bacterium]
MSKIRQYVENMFYALPKTTEVLAVKEQLIEGMEEKYGALIEEGIQEAEAFNQVVSEFGSIEELCNELNLTPVPNAFQHDLLNEYELFRKKFSKAIAAGVMLILFALASVSIMEDIFLWPEAIVTLIFLMMIGISVGLFVYFGTKNSHYEERLESLGAKRHVKVVREKNEVVEAINHVIMLIATMLFFVGGFLFHMWSIAWVVFPLAGVLCGIINGIDKIRKTK